MASGTPIRTTCPYCGVGCGVVADAAGGRLRRDHGRRAASGQFRPALLQGLGAGRDARPRRPAAPSRSRRAAAPPGTRRSTSSPTRFSETIAEHGPDSVAFYVSGQLLTEDYYVANKLMKGFIGSANIDTNSRLCMASSVAGHSRAFGADTVPGTYEDLEQADLVVLVGSNLAWCHPVLYQRFSRPGSGAARRSWSSIRAARSTGGRRRPASGDRARTPTSRCSPACSLISTAMGALRRRLCRQPHAPASTRRSQAARDTPALAASAGMRPACRPSSCASSITLFAADRAAW